MVMKCPRCVQNIHRAAGDCPHCGFTIGDADVQFGRRDMRMRCLADTAGLLRHDEREPVETAMRQITKSFPQVFVAIYTGSLGEAAHLRRFGFWLLNRAKFANLPPGTSNAAGILLTIDPESKAAGMSVGYLLEPFLEEADTFDCLARAHSHWLEGRYGDGMIKALEQLAWILRKRSNQAGRNPQHFARKLVPPPSRSAATRPRSSGPEEVER